ncbi:putative aromatic aminotransferase Aro8 [Xylogone sp. PMI_703]|nr:putative aromatic aminotransferase Aro8 [Xylogone sp. PMI_703]
MGSLPADMDTKATDTPSSIVLNSLTVDSVMSHRLNGSVPTGTAAASDSDMFKSPACFTKPKAKRWDHLFSLEARTRVASSLKGAAKYLKTSGLISLGGGLPSSENFPLEELSIKVPTPPEFTEEETRISGTQLVVGKHDIRDQKSLYDLEVALNYGQSTGAPPLLRFITEHTEILHNPRYSDWHCCITAGSTAAWDAILRILCERGDYILAEEYTFSSALETAIPLGIKAAPIKMDEQGLLPQALDEIMINWNESARGGRKPRLLYTIPSGQNPTGATQGARRREEIYKVAQKHDIYIIEDEPYYFLQMQPYTSASPGLESISTYNGNSSGKLLPSFLSMDMDGRVLRLESFSKVISPGTRAGWLVGSEQVIERFIRHFETSTQNPSGLSQLVLYKLLDEHWGHLGYSDWLSHLQSQYTRCRNVMVQACERFMPTDITSWVPPSAGMFYWIKVDWRKHPKYKQDEDHRIVEESIFKAAISKGVLLSCGSWFKADKALKEENMFFRATFAAATEDNITEAIKRFAEALKVEFSL